MRDVKPTWQGAAFVCTHVRDRDSDRAWCGLERGSELRDWIKARAKAEGFREHVLIAKSGCLGICSKQGVTVAIMPGDGSGQARQLVVFSDGDDREALWRRIRSGLGL